MLIDRIRRDPDGRRIECRVTFETGERQSHTVFASTAAPQTLEADPNGFLLGAFLPAWTAGESRIRIDGAVCPLLAANLSIAASMQRTWFTDLAAPPTIEADRAYRPVGTRTGAFLSGGVDSLAMLRSRMALPAGHPDRPSAAIVVDHPFVGEKISRDETDARFGRSLATSREIAADLGLEVIPVRSDFNRLNGAMRFWIYRYHGAFLATAAHFLGRDFRLFYIASTLPATHLVPWGSHPQLDPFYSSQHVRIVHDGVELSRLQKVEVIRDWPAALARMYVCTSGTSNGQNCGACEKCIRTRLHLLVAGALAEATAFPGHDIGESEIRASRLRSEYARLCFAEALPGLRRLGRFDLAAAVEQVIDDYVQEQQASTRPAPGLLHRVARKARRLLRGG
jgi:hypothetical protein